MSRPHLSLSLSRDLWSDFLTAALPIEIRSGEFEVTDNARSLVRQLQVRQRVAGLLEDQRSPKAVRRVTDRARSVWRRRRQGVYRRVQDVVRMEGNYSVELDDVGTQFVYGRQKVSADAYLKATLEGTLHLMKDNIELPFTLTKRVGVSMTLGDIHFDAEREAVTGRLQDLGLHVSERLALQVVNQLSERLLEQQLPRVNPIPILRRDQVSELVGGLGEALRMKMGIDDMDLEVTEDDMTLKVRFGFASEHGTEVVRTPR